MSEVLPHRPRVLVIDDDPITAQVIGKALTDDYDVHYAESGQEGLTLATRHPGVHLILLDIMMTDLDGFEVLSRLMANPATSQVPVVFVTSLDDSASEERGLAAGAVDYLYKPINPSIVRARVRVHLQLVGHRAFLTDLLERRSDDLEAAHADVTQLLRSLRESRERFRDFAESSSDAFWETDSALRIRLLDGRDEPPSGRMQLLAGQTLSHEGLGALSAAEEVPAEWETLWSHLDVLESFRNIEISVRDESGAIHVLRISAKATHDMSGQFLGYRGIGTDVTDIVEDRRQAEALRDAVEVANDGVILFNRDNRVVFANQAYRRVFPHQGAWDTLVGATREELIRSNLRAEWVVDSWARSNPDDYLSAALARDLRDSSLSDEQTHRNGRTYMRRQRHSVDGSALVVLTDITERKRAERELQQHQALLRRLASEISLAAERERRRISAELHDGAVQNLGLTRILLGTLHAKLPPGDAREEVAEIRNRVAVSIRETRALMSELSPPMLYELGLSSAVDWLARHLAERSALECTVSVEATVPRLATEVEVMLFQVVRELLLNVGKHAKARNVSVRMDLEETQLRISVTDDGVGFDPARLAHGPSEHGGFGLFHLRERLRLFGGSLGVESGASGTEARVSMEVEPLV